MNSIVDQAPTINPYRNSRSSAKRKLTPGEMVEGILKGDMTVLSQAVTLVESTNPDHYAMAQEVIEKCLPYSGNSVRVGISGVPGAGKSTSIDKFGTYVLDTYGGKLAVLAIDPSSEYSKGSILGDKTHMDGLMARKDVFIRPSPSAGSLGGVARKTRESIILCEAAGFDKIFIETVGVGQSETVCQSMVDFFLVIQLAAAGDELQGIKRGIMEMADGIAINKCDGDNVARCTLSASQLRNALNAFPMPESGWPRQVLTYSGLMGTGIKEIFEMVFSYFDFVKSNGCFYRRRCMQNKYWMRETIESGLLERFYNTMEERLEEVENAVLSGSTTSFSAAQSLLEEYYKLIR